MMKADLFMKITSVYAVGGGLQSSPSDRMMQCLLPFKKCRRLFVCFPSLQYAYIHLKVKSKELKRKRRKNKKQKTKNAAAVEEAHT